MTNLYATRAALDTRLGGQTSGQEAMLSTILEAVSRQIDQWCGRHFYVRTATRTLTTPRTDRVLVPDLLAVTTLKTDTSADLSYATTWTTADYALLPSDALLQSPPHPYWEIRTAVGGDNAFGISLHNVQVAGTWGFYEVRERSTATVAEALDASETGIDVSSGAAFAVGQTILIDSEQMYISAIATNTLTVTRGVNGTAAATHLLGAVIDVYTYPIISEACLLQAMHLYQSTQSPGGVIGGGEFGPVRFSALQPLARAMLQPFKLPGLASYGN